MSDAKSDKVIIENVDPLRYFFSFRGVDGSRSFQQHPQTLIATDILSVANPIPFSFSQLQRVKSRLKTKNPGVFGLSFPLPNLTAPKLHRKPKIRPIKAS